MNMCIHKMMDRRKNSTDETKTCVHKHKWIYLLSWYLGGTNTIASGRHRLLVCERFVFFLAEICCFLLHTTAETNTDMHRMDAETLIANFGLKKFERARREGRKYASPKGHLHTHTQQPQSIIIIIISIVLYVIPLKRWIFRETMRKTYQARQRARQLESISERIDRNIHSIPEIFCWLNMWALASSLILALRILYRHTHRTSAVCIMNQEHLHPW